jgi:argininosuccinate lyase
MGTKKPWSGRFKKKTSQSVETFTESISFDARLWKYDIQGSIAHAHMLGRQGIITKKESEKIVRGLKSVEKEIKAGTFIFRTDLEDIHMNIEASLMEKIGETGGKLHTARSRNDQVALDLRLYLRDEIQDIIFLIRQFQKTLIKIAQEHISTLMPGYTHLQRAQPVLLSHHLLAYVEMFQRDAERLQDLLHRVNRLPLGAAALAGTTFPIDRKHTAKLLGFHEVMQNSIDAVSDRDFAIEFLADASIIMMHISRLGEELVLWATDEFRFVDLPDAFSTGSSIMPQKKNPDVAELARGKAGRVYGNLVCLLTVMKGLPLSYNRDLQEDKRPVFDSADTLKTCLSVLDEMFCRITFNTERMRVTAGAGYSTATDVAEYLVRKGVPFRKAHEITGMIVLYAIENNKRLDELSLKEFRSFAGTISDDIYTHVRAEESVAKKRSSGSTSVKEVKKQIRRLQKVVKSQ